jgi:uncharacterized protein YacL
MVGPSSPSSSVSSYARRAARLLAVVDPRLASRRAGRIGRRSRRAELAALFFGGPAQQPTHRLPAVLLDTSVIIDGRILDIAKTGFVDMPLVVLSSVLRELQLVADSADAMRRRRGRRGLDVLTEMQKITTISLEVVDDDVTPSTEIDSHLVRTAKRRGWHRPTTST